MFTIKEHMKKMKKSLLLLTLSSLLLTACDIEKRSFCLDTSSVVDFKEGYCAMISPRDINQSVFIYCNKKNEKGTDYLMTWSDVLSPKYFSFSGGLEGKKVDSAVFVTTNILKVELHGLCRDETATSGYFKVKSVAFKSHAEETEDATLYAYIAIGTTASDIEKPANYTF